MSGLKLNNNRSVRFNVNSFSVPAIRPVKKNTIYTAAAENVYSAKNKLTQKETVPNYGFTAVARWRNYNFAGNSNGIYLSDESLQFVVVTNLFYPTKMFVKNNRMFAINAAGGMIYHTVDLSPADFTSHTVMEGMLYIPNEFGKCVGLSAYKDDLLLICEKSLAVVDKNLNIKFLSDDSEPLLNNIGASGSGRLWESEWFGLGYATDTQYLREVFVKTNTPVILSVISNKIAKDHNIAAKDEIQKIKTNLRGDMFKLKIVIPGTAVFKIADISAVISFGSKGA